jgi:hypothetical protein
MARAVKEGRIYVDIVKSRKSDDYEAIWNLCSINEEDGMHGGCSCQMHLVYFLALELGQACTNIRPLLSAGYKTGDGTSNLLQAGADLLCRVTVAQCEGVVLDGLEVNGDAQRCAELVVTLSSR